MFCLNDGRKELYQWDLDRVLVVTDDSVDEVHFANKTMSKALSCKTYTEEEKCLVKIPNIILQSYYDITVYAYDNNYTKHAKVFPVRKRPKPPEYIYTETEVYTVKEAVDAYLDELNITGDAVHTISTPAGADGEPNGLKAVKVDNDVAISIDETVTWVFDCGTSNF